MITKRSRNTGLFLLMAILGCLTVYSCKVTQDYQRPKFDIPTAYQLPDSVSAIADSVLIGWKDFFKDTVLENILDSAIAQNFDLEQAIKNIEEAGQYYKQSKARYAPDVNLNLLGVNKQTRSKNYYSTPASGWYDKMGGTPPENLYVYQSQFINSFDMNWEVDIWGKIKRQKEKARANYLESFEARKAVQTKLVSDIADNYYLLLMLDEQLKVANRNLDLRKHTLRMVELQYQSGEVTALAVQQTKSQVLEAAGLIPKLKGEIAINENALRLLTGNLNTSVLRTQHLFEMDTDNIIQKLPLSLVQNRPDVMSAEYALMAANATVGVTQAYRFPQISIDVAGGMNGMLASNWFSIPGSLFGGIIGGITQPLFNKRKLKTDYEVAKLERDKAEIAFQKSVFQAVTETKNASISIQQIKDQLVIANEEVDVAQKGVRSAALLFRSGFATYLEVITAQSHELESELNLASLKEQLLSARVQLYRSLGGGWK